MKPSDLLTAERPRSGADPPTFRQGDPTGRSAEALRSRPDPLAAVADDDLRPTDRPRAVQYFSDEYLQRCRCLSVQDIVQFLEEFRLNYAAAEAGRRRNRAAAR